MNSDQPLKNFIEGKFLLGKGTRKPAGHRYELYVDKNTFYAIVSHKNDPKQWYIFELDAKTYTILEQGVDAKLNQLGWK